MDERQLVIWARDGDREAFAQLYTLYKDRLYRWALYRLQNKEDAEDAVSSAVCSAYRQIYHIKKPEAFASWLFTILYYACGEVIKAREQRRKMADINDAPHAVYTTLDNTVLKTELQEALACLTDEEREIVLLSVVAGLSSRDISRICALSAGGVRSKLSRSLKKMREFLEGDNDEK